jgi:5-methylcytosine-specific restriction endonuclease McrA
VKDIFAPLFLVIISAVIYILSLRNDREQANKKLEKVTDELSLSTNKLKQIQVNYTELQEELERHDQATRTLIRSQYAQREATMAAGSAWRNMELRELAETYPYIPFLPEEQTLSRILHDYIMDNPSIDANKLYHFHALNQYKFAFLRKNKDISICWLGDKKFWHQYDYLSELDQEYPELDPPDWKIRRKIVHEREHGICQRCGKHLTLSQSHIHHIIPRCDLGTHHVENLSLLCPDCHTYMPDHEWMRDREKVGYYDERTSKWKSQFQEQLDLITNNGEYVYRW